MQFDWDEAKEAEVRAERGHGFGVPIQIFGGRVVEWEDDRHDYGEVRLIGVGRAEGTIWTVVYTRPHWRTWAVSLDHHSVASGEMGA